MGFPTTFPVITSERIVLADISTVGVDEFLPIAMRGGKLVTDRTKVAELIQTLGQDFKRGQTLCWGIFLDGVLIGMVGYFRGFAGEQGEVGYTLHADYRGKGYMNEALKLVIEYGWHTLNLTQISAHTAPDNAPSIALLNAAGFHNTGVEQGGYVVFVLPRSTAQ